MDFTQAVVQIRNANGGVASGVLIADDLVLTATHPLYSSGAGSVAAGLELPITVSWDGVQQYPAEVIGYNKITDVPNLLVTASEMDFALLHLSTPFPDHPKMGYQADWPAGHVTITGYPNGGGLANLENCSVSVDSGVDPKAPNRVYKTPYPQPGYSGGPLWITDGTIAQVVGIVSSHAGTDYGEACQLTLATVQTIEQWIAGLGRSPAVRRLYRCVFNRLPDTEGLTYWSKILLDYDIAMVCKGFTQSPEFSQTWGSTNNTNIVREIYTRALGRVPEPDGLAYWAALPLTWALIGITQSAEAITHSAVGVL